MLSSLMYVTDLRAYVALDICERLLLLVLFKEKMELLVLMTVECLYNAMCLAFIKETKQVIVGGTGYLNKYIFLSGFENSAKLEKAGSVNCSLQKSELLRRIIVDGVAHTLVVLTENRLLMLDYRTWTEMRSMKDPESGTLTCYAVYQENEYFITGGRSGLIKVWNPKVYTEVHCFKGHKTKIVDVRVSNARSLLFSASDDGWVFIWRMDIFKTPLQKVQVGDTISTMGLTNEKGKRGFWCMVENAIVLYEYEMFYDDYAMMDSTVFKLERVSGYDDHPNRIMVVTEDGGMRHLNPVTASLVGYMFPMTTLRLIENYIYNAFRRRTYMVLGEGGVMVLNCEQSPFRSLEMYKATTQDDGVSCITSALVSIGDIEDVIIFAGFRNGQIQLLYSDSFVMLRPVQAHHASVEVLELVSEVVPTGEAVFQTTSFIVSAGNDCLIKLWNIQCRPDPVSGLDIKLLKLLEPLRRTCDSWLAVSLYDVTSARLWNSYGSLLCW
ncbi:WD repeat-containing protein 87-like [Littorina saxatilis]|uniref:WD repeat-containing protein 87-like n=1 Tax=Littorina saxatilis TaxID=31220 RepID=UPI0038B580B5